MRILVSAAVMALGVTSWACPNLQGTYLCNEDGNKYMTTVTQNGAGVDTIYNINGGKHFVDGEARETSETQADYTLNTVTTSYCNSNSSFRTHNIHEAYMNSGEEFQYWETLFQYGKKMNGLEISVTRIEHPSGEKSVITEFKMFCERI